MSGRSARAERLDRLLCEEDRVVQKVPYVGECLGQHIGSGIWRMYVSVNTGSSGLKHYSHFYMRHRL